MIKRLMDATEAGEYLGIQPQRVYDMVRKGILPAVRLGRQVRFDQVQLEDWICEGGKALPGGWKYQKD
jgi:excisionase family DNA binding protein